MRIRSGLVATALVTVLVAPAASGASPSASPPAEPPPTSIGTADEARGWLEDHGLEVEPFDVGAASGVVGTRDGLEVRMTLEGDRLVRSDLRYTSGTLVGDQAAREEVIFPWRRDWAADAEPYIRVAFQSLTTTPMVVRVPLQVPMSDRTYGVDLFDLADLYATASPAPALYEDAVHREWVAVRPPGPAVLAASMSADRCVDGEFSLEIGPGPMEIDYRVTLGESNVPGTPWLILAIMPGIMFEPDLDVTVDGGSLHPVRLAENAVAIPIGAGMSEFTLEQAYSDSLNGHMGLVVMLPEAEAEPSEAELVDAVASSGFGWGRLWNLLCQPSAFPMPPAPGPLVGRRPGE